MKYQWDNNKNISNITKHGIDFSEALDVFNDPNSLLRQDTRRDYGEERFQIIGMAQPVGIVFVVFTERKGDIIRIISARKANSREKRIYDQNAG